MRRSVVCCTANSILPDGVRNLRDQIIIENVICEVGSTVIWLLYWESVEISSCVVDVKRTSFDLITLVLFERYPPIQRIREKDCAAESRLAVLDSINHSNLNSLLQCEVSILGTCSIPHFIKFQGNASQDCVAIFASNKPA